MLEPKEVMMSIEDAMLTEFEEEHGREPTVQEATEISDRAYAGIGDYYADLIDHQRDLNKYRRTNNAD